MLFEGWMFVIGALLTLSFHKHVILDIWPRFFQPWPSSWQPSSSSSRGRWRSACSSTTNVPALSSPPCPNCPGRKALRVMNKKVPPGRTEVFRSKHKSLVPVQPQQPGEVGRHWQRGDVSLRWQRGFGTVAHWSVIHWHGHADGTARLRAR